jgi:hypothetical protein
MNNIQMLENLKILDAIFKRHSLSYWLQDGTLLGLYREKNFISHDHDSDIGVNFNDISPNVIKEIYSAGFRHKYVLGEVDNSLVIGLTRKKCKTDLFFYYSRGNIVYHSAFTRNEDIRIDYEYTPFGVKNSIFLKHNFLIPDNELKFIETKYGTNWNLPDKDWDYAYSPKNHVKTNIRINRTDCLKNYINWINSND